MIDSWRGTVEQGCPLCRWWGVSGAFNAHWATHGIIDKLTYNFRRWWKAHVKQR